MNTPPATNAHATTHTGSPDDRAYGAEGWNMVAIGTIVIELPYMLENGATQLPVVKRTRRREFFRGAAAAVIDGVRELQKFGN